MLKATSSRQAAPPLPQKVTHCKVTGPLSTLRSSSGWLSFSTLRAVVSSTNVNTILELWADNPYLKLASTCALRTHQKHMHAEQLMLQLWVTFPGNV
jgi:hypothetical protein